MLPPDPVPIYYPSLEPFIQDETDFHSITAPATIDPTTGIPIPNVTVLQSQAGNDMLEQPTGEPTGLEQNAVMPLENGVHYRVQLSPLSITAVGTDQIAVRAMRRPPDASEHFPQDVLALQAFHASAGPNQRIVAVPAAVSEPVGET